MQIRIGKLLELLELLRDCLNLRNLIFASLNSLDSSIDSNNVVFIDASSKMKKVYTVKSITLHKYYICFVLKFC